MLIGIHGRIGHGKDTVADFLMELNPLFEKHKFANFLKEFCAKLIGCDVSDFESQEFKNTSLPSEWDVDGRPMLVRELLQRAGTEGGRIGIHPDVWVNTTLRDYRSDLHWVVSDVRFPNEADRIKKLGGYLVKVVRETLPRPSHEHESETALDSYDKWDYIIYNNYDMEALQDTVDVMYNGVINAEQKKQTERSI